MKVNSDGAMAKMMDKCGEGVVLRDHDGRFLAGSCHFFLLSFRLYEAELRACEQELKVIKRLKLTM